MERGVAVRACTHLVRAQFVCVFTRFVCVFTWCARSSCADAPSLTATCRDASAPAAALAPACAAAAALASSASPSAACKAAASALAPCSAATWRSSASTCVPRHRRHGQHRSTVSTVLLTPQKAPQYSQNSLNDTDRRWNRASI
eukprot:1195881-Prorocentrum_minimum.AAC.2